MLRETSKLVNMVLMATVKKTAPCCPPVLHARFGDDDADALAGAFKALADPARLKLLHFIAAQPGGEACVCHLTAPVGLSQPTVSHHLKLLNAAGLLDREKRGTWVYYRIVPERLEALQSALTVPPAAATRVRKRA
jgi:ArsR family transcriptional regulator, arsenate/arsenite/antimonite-responsive transcriptional repressor